MSGLRRLRWRWQRRGWWRGWIVRPQFLLWLSAAQFLVLLRLSDAVVQSEPAVFVHREASLAFWTGFPDTVSRSRLLGLSFPRGFGFLFLLGERRIVISVHLVVIRGIAWFVSVEPTQASAVAYFLATLGAGAGRLWGCLRGGPGCRCWCNSLPADLSTAEGSFLMFRLSQAFLSRASVTELDLSDSPSVDSSLESLFALLSHESVRVPRAADAIRDPEWSAAMREEIQSLHDNNTFSLVSRNSLPAGANVVNSLWVLTAKKNGDGSTRPKARLVADGSTQEDGVDVGETFAPVCKMSTFRIFLSLAASHGLRLRHLDVKNAFLQGNLDEEVFMRQPPYFAASGQEHMVCRLNRPIYGLKQSPRCWNKRLSECLQEFGFVVHFRRADVCLFVQNMDGKMLVLLVYVDDIVVGENCEKSGGAVVAHLMSTFKMRDLGFPSFCLGMHITQVDQGLVLTQHQCAQQILNFANLSECCAVRAPMDPKLKLSRRTPGEAVCDQHRYRRIVGALLFLLNSRPELCFAVSTLCKFVSDPSVVHWSALEHVLRYLRGTIFHGILYRRQGSCNLEAFADASWKSDPDDGKSVSGLLVVLNQSPVVFGSRKQQRVATSSTEAEYYALASTIKYVCWCRQILSDFGRHQCWIQRWYFKTISRLLILQLIQLRTRG